MIEKMSKHVIIDFIFLTCSEDAKHPITVNTQSQGQTTSLPATQTLPPTVKMAIPNTVSKFEASGDSFEESGDLSEVSGDMSEQSGDTP